MGENLKAVTIKPEQFILAQHALDKTATSNIYNTFIFSYTV